MRIIGFRGWVNQSYWSKRLTVNGFGERIERITPKIRTIRTPKSVDSNPYAQNKRAGGMLAQATHPIRTIRTPKSVDSNPYAQNKRAGGMLAQVTHPIRTIRTLKSVDS